VTDALHALTYVSRADAGLNDDDVYRIYKSAMEYNTLDGITGLLVYDGACFLQIVEGAHEALYALVKRMSHDSRHADLNIIDERIIERRSFADWSMKLVKIDRAHMQGVASLDTELGPRVDPEIRAMLLDAVAKLPSLC
jgi:hypothetical protein